MLKAHKAIFQWVVGIAFVLLCVKSFAPISDTLDDVLTGVLVAIWLTLFGIYWIDDRREQAKRPRLPKP